MESRYKVNKIGYLIDIQVENTNNCPEGYTPLLNYKWSGTNDGCYCHSNSNGYTFDFVLLVNLVPFRVNAQAI